MCQFPPSCFPVLSDKYWQQGYEGNIVSIKWARKPRREICLWTHSYCVSKLQLEPRSIWHHCFCFPHHSMLPLQQVKTHLSMFPVSWYSEGHLLPRQFYFCFPRHLRWPVLHTSDWKVVQLTIWGLWQDHWKWIHYLKLPERKLFLVSICRRKRIYMHWPQATKYRVIFQPIILIPSVSHKTTQDWGDIQSDKMKTASSGHTLCLSPGTKFEPLHNTFIPQSWLCGLILWVASLQDAQQCAYICIL